MTPVSPTILSRDVHKVLALFIFLLETGSKSIHLWTSEITFSPIRVKLMCSSGVRQETKSLLCFWEMVRKQYPRCHLIEFKGKVMNVIYLSVYIFIYISIVYRLNDIFFLFFPVSYDPNSGRCPRWRWVCWNHRKEKQTLRMRVYRCLLLICRDFSAKTRPLRPTRTKPVTAVTSADFL